MLSKISTWSCTHISKRNHFSDPVFYKRLRIFRLEKIQKADHLWNVEVIPQTTNRFWRLSRSPHYVNRYCHSSKGKIQIFRLLQADEQVMLIFLQNLLRSFSIMYMGGFTPRSLKIFLGSTSQALVGSTCIHTPLVLLLIASSDWEGVGSEHQLCWHIPWWYSRCWSMDCTWSSKGGVSRQWLKDASPYT